MKHLLIFIAIATLFCGCVNDKKENKKIATDTTVASKPSTAVDKDGLSQQDSIKATGRQVLIFLKENNYQELIKYFSSEGVVFSPYGYIDTLKNLLTTPIILTPKPLDLMKF